tara:strand:- start:1376 stop:2521 length:1146 start_codon:yes stop_codon:yes gene_type:complete
MKKKMFNSLGLMSGTSMDGVDLSVIKSDGYSKIEYLYDKYYEFDDNLFSQLIELRNCVNSTKDLSQYLEKIKNVEKTFTLFNSSIVKDIINTTNIKLDLIGFHGQTILHLPDEKISKQIGDGHLLSQLTKCLVVNNFRQNDLMNGGQGAPLVPIFHDLISQKLIYDFNLEYPMNIINIGGITNVTQIIKKDDLNHNIFAYDIAPGNCLIDQWLRKKSDKKIDENGELAKLGKVDKLIFNQAIENFEIKSIKGSLDIKNFDISFVKGLSLEDGCATLTKFTAFLISEGLKTVDKENKFKTKNNIVCGGGRKNQSLIKDINKFLGEKEIFLNNIDNYKLNGDFIESQAFAYIAIRSFLDLPISFPNTTRCKKPTKGGSLIKNF